MKLQYKNNENKTNTQAGFAVVEAIFTVIIIAIVIGGGIYLSQRKNTESKDSTSQTDSSSTGLGY